MNGASPKHVAYGVKGARDCLLQGNYVLGHHCGRVGCLSWAGIGAMVCWGPKERLQPIATG